MTVKKIYVYGAKLVEMHRKLLNSGEFTVKSYLITNNVFAGEKQTFLYENAWKGAEAYHYYMLAQRLIYGGKFHDALCVAYKLQEFEEFIPESDIYSLLTLAACLDRSFGVCSKALIKLKSLENVCFVRLRI